MLKHLTSAVAVIAVALLLCTWTASGYVAAAPAKKADPRAAARKAAEKESKRILKAAGKRIRGAAKSAVKEIRRITKIVKKGKGYDKLGPDVPVFAKGGAGGADAPPEVVFYAWERVCGEKDGYGSLSLQVFDETNEQACDSAVIETYLNYTLPVAHTTAFAFNFSAALYKPYFDGYCDVQSACGDAFEEISAQGGYCTQASEPLPPPRPFFTSTCGSPRTQQLADVYTFTLTLDNGSSSVVTRVSGCGVQAFEDAGFEYQLEVRCRNVTGDLVYVSEMQPDPSGYYYIAIGDVDASRGGGVFAARSYVACEEYNDYGLEYYDDDDDDDGGGGFYQDDDDDEFDDYVRSGALSCYYSGIPETPLPADCVASNETMTEMFVSYGRPPPVFTGSFVQFVVDVIRFLSDLTVVGRVPDGTCELSKCNYVTLPFVQANAKPGPAAVLAEDRFPPGAGPVGFTLLPDIQGPDPDSDLLILSMVLQEDVPLSDPTHLYQYGFVFDQDGNTANNFVPLPRFSNDFFQNTDKWYEVLYTPQGGWSLKVTDARNGGFAQVASAARAVINGNSITLAVPVSEFAVTRPSFRLSAFRHTGDFGLNPPHDYSADYFPDPDEPLQPFDR